VLIDDEEVGRTPVESLVVSAGRVLTIKKPGFETYTKRLEEVSGKKVDLRVKLESLQRTTDVEIQVMGVQSASIVIDGNEAGLAGPTMPYRGKVSVRSEPHSFEARATGFVTSSDSKLAVEGQRLRLSFALSRLQDTAILSVDALPSGAQIEIDGKLVGANHWEGPVRVGTRSVKFSKEGFYTRTREITVAAGERRPVTESLDENKSSSWLGWALGSSLVLAGVTVASVFLLSPRTDPITGSLRNTEGTPVDTARFRFR
jgi:PEGA domain